MEKAYKDISKDWKYIESPKDIEDESWWSGFKDIGQFFFLFGVIPLLSVFSPLSKLSASDSTLYAIIGTASITWALAKRGTKFESEISRLYIDDVDMGFRCEADFESYLQGVYENKGRKVAWEGSGVYVRRYK